MATNIVVLTCSVALQLSTQMTGYNYDVSLRIKPFQHLASVRCVYALNCALVVVRMNKPNNKPPIRMLTDLRGLNNAAYRRLVST